MTQNCENAGGFLLLADPIFNAHRLPKVAEVNRAWSTIVALYFGLLISHPLELSPSIFNKFKVNPSI